MEITLRKEYVNLLSLPFLVLSHRFIAARDDFPGKQLHRAPDGFMVDHSALVEIGNELLHREFLGQGVDTVDAVVGVTKDAEVAVNPCK